MTNLSTTLRKHLKERRDESLENIKRAEEIETLLVAKREELLRHTTRRDACLRLGDEHGQVEWTAEVKDLGLVVDMEPLRTLLTGKELAKQFDAKVNVVEDEIAGLEAELAELAA